MSPKQVDGAPPPLSDAAATEHPTADTLKPVLPRRRILQFVGALCTPLFGGSSSRLLSARPEFKIAAPLEELIVASRRLPLGLPLFAAAQEKFFTAFDQGEPIHATASKLESTPGAVTRTEVAQLQKKLHLRPFWIGRAADAASAMDFWMREIISDPVTAKVTESLKESGVWVNGICREELDATIDRIERLGSHVEEEHRAELTILREFFGSNGQEELLFGEFRGASELEALGKLEAKYLGIPQESSGAIFGRLMVIQSNLLEECESEILTSLGLEPEVVARLRDSLSEKGTNLYELLVEPSRDSLPALEVQAESDWSTSFPPVSTTFSEYRHRLAAEWRNQESSAEAIQKRLDAWRLEFQPDGDDPSIEISNLPDELDLKDEKPCLEGEPYLVVSAKERPTVGLQDRVKFIAETMGSLEDFEMSEIEVQSSQRETILVPAGAKNIGVRVEIPERSETQEYFLVVNVDIPIVVEIHSLYSGEPSGFALLPSEWLILSQDVTAFMVSCGSLGDARLIGFDVRVNEVDQD